MAFKTGSERFGSAAFASIKELKAAGLLNGEGLHHGFTLFKRKREQICFASDTGLLGIGSAGSQKLVSTIAYHAIAPMTSVFVDPKGEIFAISNGSPFEERYCFNPYGLHAGAPWFAPTNHRFNILEFADPDSISFFEDMQTMAMNLLSKPAGGGGEASTFFWTAAVKVMTALLMYGRELNKHFSLPDLFNVVNDIMSGESGDFFSMHIDQMKRSRFANVRGQAESLVAQSSGATGQFTGVMGTIEAAVKILGSPALQVALSGPSTINFKDFLKPDKVRKFFIMIPAHLLEPCASLIRAIITSLTIEQQRNPLGSLHICIDEAGQLKGFSLLPLLYSYGRGSKCKVSSYFQNPLQGVACLGKENFDTVVSNSQSKIIHGVSSFESGKFVSEMLGKTTYRYLPQSKQTEAAFKRTQAFRQMLNGGDFTHSLLEITKQGKVMQTPDAVARELKTPDEVMRIPSNMGILDIQGVIRPYLFLKLPYFQNPAVAHRFLPNPFHPPYDRIYAPNRFGRMKSVKIITEKVPPEIAHLPQYSSGYWSYPEGFNPLKPKRFGLF